MLVFFPKDAQTGPSQGTRRVTGFMLNRPVFNESGRFNGISDQMLSSDRLSHRFPVEPVRAEFNNTDLDSWTENLFVFYNLQIYKDFDCIVIKR